MYLLRYLFKLPTIIGFVENQLSQSVLSFTTPTIVLRRFLLQSPVQTFIILTMVKSLCFGSNFRHYFVILTFGLTTHILASKINLVTHYAKGTFFFFELLIKLLFWFFLLSTFLYRSCTIFSLWGRFPILFKQFLFVLLYRLLYFYSRYL